jgi:outer-membrane receptor for ferric coprogen and ferric-rhodotorulic acid
MEAQMNHPARKLTSVATAVAMAFLAAPAVVQTAASAAAAASAPTPHDAAATSSSEVTSVVITGQRANRVSNGATNLDLDAKETPQSISFVTQEQMKNFGADDINDALRLTTGIRVEQVGTNQTQFLSRGFEIKNTQIDGVGMPNGWGIVTNSMDTFGYDKVEVIRGANGLLTGVGNASGTINYVRKRPTNEAKGSIGVSYGSWGTKRIEADYSTPLTSDGGWAARVVAAHEDGDSYLRDFKSDRTFLYATVDGQIGDHGSLALGYSRQQSDTSHNMWGTLTFVSNTGTQLDLPRSASTTQDWTYWNDTTQTAFVEYTQDLGDDWRAKASYNYRSSVSPSQLFMGYSPTGLDAATGTGLYGWGYKSTTGSPAHLFDLSFNGHYDLFGHKHEATFGASLSESKQNQYYYPTSFAGPAFGALPGFPYAGDAIPESTWGDKTFYTSLNQRVKRAYAVTRLTLADPLHAIIGINWTQYHRDGVDSLAVPFNQTETNSSPYVGITYDFTGALSAYANYSYIYQPQEQYTRSHEYIEPSKGTNYEIGVKGEWMDKRLLTTLAWFDARQKGLATYVGTVFLDGSAFAAYDGVDVESKGVEFEATGKINQYVDLVLGYTHLDMSGAETGKTYPWVPRHMANVMLSARVPDLTALSLGLSGRWQSGTSNNDSYSGYTVRQGGYATANAFAAWEFKPGLTLRGNVNNITNHKYINSLYIASYYAAPRNYTVSMDYRF